MDPARRLVFSLVLIVVCATGVLATSYRPLSELESEAFLAEAIRYATISWQVGSEEFTGVPYTWGGRTDIHGFLQGVEDGGDPSGLGVDASGLIVVAAKAVSPDFRFRVPTHDGYAATTNVNSSMLYAHNVVPIALTEIRPGDLIFFGSNGTIDGVAIYERTVGRSIRFIVASANAGRVVQTGANLDGEYWATRFAGAGRLLRSEE